MTIISDIYKRFAPKHTLYVRLYKNHAEIKHIESGNSIAKNALNPYSNDRLIIADFNLAEQFYKDIISELLITTHSIFEKGLRIILQPVDLEIKEISDVESRIYQDFAYNIGAREYYLCRHQSILSNEDVLSYKI
jgi:hypothetical protein